MVLPDACSASKLERSMGPDCELAVSEPTSKAAEAFVGPTAGSSVPCLNSLAALGP